MSRPLVGTSSIVARPATRASVSLLLTTLPILWSMTLMFNDRTRCLDGDKHVAHVKTQDSADTTQDRRHEFGCAGPVSEPQGSPGHNGGQDRGQALPPAGPSFTTRRSSEAHGEASMNACVPPAACLSHQCSPMVVVLSGVEAHKWHAFIQRLSGLRTLAHARPALATPCRRSETKRPYTCSTPALAAVTCV